MSETDKTLERFKRKGSSTSELLAAMEKDGHRVKRQHRPVSVILGSIEEIIRTQARFAPGYTNTRLLELIDECRLAVARLELETDAITRELNAAMSTITEAADICERIGRE